MVPCYNEPVEVSATQVILFPLFPTVVTQSSVAAIFCNGPFSIEIPNVELLGNHPDFIPLGSCADSGGNRVGRAEYGLSNGQGDDRRLRLAMVQQLVRSVKHTTHCMAALSLSPK